MAVLGATAIPNIGFESDYTPAPTGNAEDQISQIIDGSAFLAVNPAVGPKTAHLKGQVYQVVATAYTSVPEQTDDTPNITASGTYTRDGVIAANFLPIGTAVKIPKLFGDKVFLVEDRMHPRNGSKIDIWLPTVDAAKRFGVKLVKIVVL